MHLWPLRACYSGAARWRPAPPADDGSLLSLAVPATTRNSSEDTVASSTVAARPVPAPKCGATLAEFYERKIGVPYAAARDIIGCEGKFSVSQSGWNERVMVGWGAQTAMFGNMHATSSTVASSRARIPAAVGVLSR
jgi:hypothetical protein